MILRDRVGHRVDEPEHHARRGAFLRLDGLAGITLAVTVGVVLRHREDRRLRVLLDPLAHLGDADLQDVGIRQAELIVALDALAVDHREVLGVRIEVPIGRHQRIERVDERPVHDLAADRIIEPLRIAVDAIADGPVAVEGLPVERFAILERRLLGDVERATLSVGFLGILLIFAVYQRQPKTSSSRP